MIFGDCPYCGRHVTIYAPDIMPIFIKEVCQNCGKEFWEYCSRVNPQAFKWDDVIVDEDAMTVKLRKGVEIGQIADKYGD